MPIAKFNKLDGKGKGYVALFITSFFWGTTWVASKIAVEEIPPLQLSCMRQLFAGTIFVGYFLLYKKLPFPTLKQWKWLFFMSALMFFCANFISTQSLKYIPTGLAALIGALYPLSVVLIEWIFFKNKNITALTFVGLFLGISGIVFVFYHHMYHKIDAAFLWGVFLSVIAMLAWSLATIFLARNKMNINPYFGTGWQMLISAFVLFFVGKFTHQLIPVEKISLTAWLMMAYLVTFGSVICFIAFIFSAKILPPTISSLYAYINPLVAIVTASIILGEKLTWSLAWGSIVTLLGVYIVNLSIKKDQQNIIGGVEQ